jgi:hypothetical protein
MLPNAKRLLRFCLLVIAMSLLITLVHFGLASRRLEVRTPPSPPFDAIIVPGCPCAEGGALTRAQARRAMWAAILWERGYTRYFITSGAAVHSPYVEAEALAAAMTALGVPAERIYLEPDALHTDENIYNALRIARVKGWARLAVASDRGQAVGACQMLESWHPQCGAFSMDYELVDRRLLLAPQVQAIRATAIGSGFVPLPQREAERARLAGRPPRPRSSVLYPLMLLRKGFSQPPWEPFAPADTPLVGWATRTRQ